MRLENRGRGNRAVKSVRCKHAKKIVKIGVGVTMICPGRESLSRDRPPGPGPEFP